MILNLFSVICPFNLGVSGGRSPLHLPHTSAPFGQEQPKMANFKDQVLNEEKVYIDTKTYVLCPPMGI